MDIKDIISIVSKVDGGREAIRHFMTEGDYLKAPASSKYHSAFEGGLVYHSVKVVKNLVRFTELFGLKWDRPESPYIIGLFHDLCKVDFYKVSYRNAKDASGNWVKVPYYEVDDKDPLGHGEKSVVLLQQYMKLTEQEMYSIYYHMGAFGDPSYVRNYSNACKKHPEIMVVALADQMAGVEEDLVEAQVDRSKFGGLFTYEKIDREEADIFGS